MTAYTRLSKSRDMNGNISITDILSYSDHFILINTLEEFIDVIYIIDEVIQGEQRRKAEAKKAQQKNVRKPPPIKRSR